MEKILLSMFLLAAMGCVLIGTAGAMDHIVGGSFGWSVPKNLSYYQDWAKPRTFGVGDKLVFLYRTGVHSVMEVTEKEFDACTQVKVIEMLYKGPTILELTELGNHYYYCGVGTHCEGGQKLSITVTNELGSAGTPVTFDSTASDSSTNTSSTTATDPKSAAANSIRTFGVVVGLLSLLVSLFI